MQEIGKHRGVFTIAFAIVLLGFLIYTVIELNNKSLVITAFWLILYSLNFLGMTVAVFHKSPKLSPIAKGGFRLKRENNKWFLQELR
jgi:predicted membrane protein